MWPRPVQQPHPPIWMPVTAARRRSSSPGSTTSVITPGLAPGGLQEDIIRYYAKCLAATATRSRRTTC